MIKAREKACHLKRTHLAKARPEPGFEPAVTPAPAAVSPEFRDLKRFIFQKVALKESAINPIKIATGDKVAIFSFGSRSALTVEVNDYLSKKLQATTVVLDLAEDYDLRVTAGVKRTVSKLNELPDLSGVILLLDQSSEDFLAAMEEIPAFLTGFFQVLQNLMRLPGKKFCLAIQRDLNPAGVVAVAAEGVVGMFLDAALEYESVLFRSLTVDRETVFKNAFNNALDQNNKLVQMILQGQEVFGIEARQRPVISNGGPELSLKSGDVIIISGGGQGISSHLAFALSPFSPRLILLGRSNLDSAVDYERMSKAKINSEEAVRRWLAEQKSDFPGDQFEAEVAKIWATFNIRQSLEEISRLGMEVKYYSCDVTDKARVQEVIAEVAADYGRIDGLIHGAGVLRDAFIDSMSPKDFADVVEVKFLGAWNLYKAACHHGLRFFTMLSSVTAVQGNTGQVNYCAANRAMSALTQVISVQHPDVKVKVLMLPPIEDVGMAADSDLKKLMKLRGWEGAYLKVNELAALFCRELLLGPMADTWVMFIRNLPEVKTTRLDMHNLDPKQNYLTIGGVAFPEYELPMIQTVHRMDLNEGLLEAGRTFSLDYDLWINDHRPFKFLKNPFISGIMAVETFIEAAHLLYPHLRPLGIRQVEYRDIMECPPGVERKTLITCHRLPPNGASNELHCQVEISSPDITATGRILDRWSTNYVGEVILGNGNQAINLLPNFTVRPEEIETPPLSHEEVTRFYKKYSNLQGRYRMIDKLYGAGLGVVRGQMIYKYNKDFANLNGTKYLYSPYLLEAIQHLVNCYLLLWDEDIFQPMIPYKIGEMRFTRQCEPNELIILEGRLKSGNEDEYIWNAQAVDSAGKPIMQVTDLVFKPFKA